MVFIILVVMNSHEFIIFKTGPASGNCNINLYEQIFFGTPQPPATEIHPERMPVSMEIYKDDVGPTGGNLFLLQQVLQWIHLVFDIQLW